MSEDINHAEAFARRQQATLPGELGITWDHVRRGDVRGRMTVAAIHMAPNGYLHAASVIALVDSASGYGCMVSLPRVGRVSPLSNLNRTSWPRRSWAMWWLAMPVWSMAAA